MNKAVTANLSNDFVPLNEMPKEKCFWLLITWTVIDLYSANMNKIPGTTVSSGETVWSNYRKLKVLDNWSVTALYEKSKSLLQLQTCSLEQARRVSVTDRVHAWLPLSCQAHSAEGASLLGCYRNSSSRLFAGRSRKKVCTFIVYSQFILAKLAMLLDSKGVVLVSWNRQ